MKKSGCVSTGPHDSKGDCLFWGSKASLDYDEYSFVRT